MSFFRPLDDAFGSTSKVRLLRLLVEQDRIVSAREAARLIGMSLPPVLAAINDLAELGLILREESGKQFLCKANREHRLYQLALKPLFDVEATWSSLVFSAIRTVLVGDKASGVLVAWIFGSVTKGEDQPGSDLDLFALTADEAAEERTKEKLAESLPSWRREFGADVRPMVMSRARAVSEWRGGNKLLRSALKHARIILGELPPELRHG